MTHASHVAPEGLCFGEALGVKRMEALREGDRVTIGIWFRQIEQVWSGAG